MFLITSVSYMFLYIHISYSLRLIPPTPLSVKNKLEVCVAAPPAWGCTAVCVVCMYLCIFVCGRQSGFKLDCWMYLCEDNVASFCACMATWRWACLAAGDDAFSILPRGGFLGRCFFVHAFCLG